MFWLNPQIPIKSKIIVIDKPEPFSKIITKKFYLKGDTGKITTYMRKLS